MRFSTPSSAGVRASLSSRLALMLSLPVMLLFLVASAAFATPIMPPLMQSSADLPATAAFEQVVLHLSADADVKIIRRALVDLSKKGLVRHIMGDASALYLEATPDALPELKKIEGVADVAFASRAATRGAQAPSQAPEAEFKTYWLTMPEQSETKAWSYLHNSLARWQAEGHVSQIERLNQKTMRVVIKADAVDLLDGLPETVEASETSPAARLSWANGSSRMAHPAQQGQIRSQPYWLLLKPTSVKDGVSAALLRELGNLQAKGLVLQFERSLKENRLRVIAFSTAEEELKQLPSVLNVSHSSPAASQASRAATGGGQITGTVDAPDGTPLAEIWVMVHRYNPQTGYWEWINDVLTEADGQYNVSELQTGSYRVCFLKSWDGPYLEECYDDISLSEWESATDISVTEGETTAGIDATLNEGGHITGTITDLNGNPLPDIEVVAFSDEWGGEGYANTDENGYYDMAGLYTGDYRVCFYNWEGPYLEECYDDMPDWESATLVPVTVEETTAGIDAVLSEGGHITGTITDSDDNPIAGVEVSTHWYNPEGGWQWGSYAYTNENGQYDVAGLRGGIHRLCFTPDWESPYLYECYNDVAEWDNATDITVTVGETIAGLDASLSDGGHITGSVTNSAGNPVPGVEVVVFNYYEEEWEWEEWGYWNWLNSSYTDANGQYDLAGLQTGSYRVCFYNWDGSYLEECYDDATYVEEATDISVTVEETTSGIDAVLTSGGNITGTVTDSDGNPVSEVEVVAHWYTPWGYWEWQNSGYTDANGQYDVTRLQTGSYRIGFFDWQGRYIEEYYDDAATLESAADIAVTAEETTAGIDAVLSGGGHITGTVTDSDGNPISGVEVVAHGYNADWNEWGWGNYGYTDENGQYEITRLQTGNYRVGFFEWEGRYVAEYYDDAATLESATDIAVTVEQTTAGIDAVLSEGGHITGTVTDPDGNPVSGVEVVAHWYNPDWNEWWGAYYGYTDENGQYDIAGLQTGSYRVGFFDWEGRYVEEYYDDATTLESATDIAVTVEQTTAGIDAVLSSGGHITGTVTAPDGNPLPYINVEVYRYHTEWDYWEYVSYGYTDETGQYDVAALQTGSYRVGFFTWEGQYLSEYYDNASTVESATDVDVIIEQTTSGIDALLDEGGHITGMVTDPDGNPLPEVSVEVYRYNELYDYWEGVGYSYTDGNGQYDVPGLHSGSHRVAFFDWQERYLSEYYLDAPDLESAMDVSVTAGETTANIDASLNDGGHITGTVTDADGNPLVEVGVEVYRYNSVEQYWQWAGYAYTDGSGQYHVENLHTGNHRVGFFAWNGQYLSEYYDNASTVESGSDIAVIAGQTTAGIDAALSEGGHIRGTVTDTEGNPVYGIDVEVYHYNTQTQSWEWGGYGYTNPDGTYDVPGLYTGTYRVGFMDWNERYAREYYDDATDLEDATDVAVTVSETTSGIDASLQMGGRLEGSVTTSDGSAGRDVSIEVYRLSANADWELVGWGYTGMGGNYVIGGLRSGTYRLGFFDWTGNYFTKYYADATDLNSATDIAVTAGETISEIDVMLEEGGHITGQVSGEAAALRGGGENGLRDIQVEAYRYNGSHWEAVGFGYTDWNGNYDIAGLASGVYRVGFFEPFGIYAYEYYDNASNLANASEVVVIAGETTANINASLGDAAEAIAHATSASGSLIVDPQTGQITIIQPSWNLTNITITVVATCSDESIASDVTLLVGEDSYLMSATGNENEYSATIPAAEIEDGAQISLSQLCNGSVEEQAIGQIQILQDPSGYITDAETGEAVADAKVTLYNVPSWRARSSAVEENDRTPNTCQSNLSKAADEPWSQEAPTELGVLATADESQIDPAINPIMTAPDGFYGWDVTGGCWYVIVEADGYQRLVSPVVGVPPEVTDLDLALMPANASSVSFSESEIEVPEHIESAVISITLTTVPTETVSVEYTTLNDTATAGSDYTTARGTLTFLPGETIKSISITILDDERHEANESLRILLSNPINASLGLRNQVELTIIDNEPPLDHHIYLPLMNGSSD